MWCALAFAPASAQTGGIVGRVVSNETGEPLAYSIVSLTKQGSAFFANDSGRFAITNLQPGPLELQIRRLGYTPANLVVHIEANVVDTVTIRLSRIAMRLNTVTVRSWPPCKNPGPPTADHDSTLASIFDQLKQNAQQFELLADSYPFVYTMDVELSRLLRSPKKVIVTKASLDTVRSKGPESYSPGRVIQRVGGEWLFIIPTLLQFADQKFLSAHCFHFAGTEGISDSSFIRVDVVASEGLKDSDVNGSIYLDPENFQVRRTVMSLSRPPRFFPYIVSMEVVTDFREVLPTISVIGHVFSTQTTNPKSKVDYDELYETQDLIAVNFVRAVPGKDALIRGKQPNDN